MNGSRVEMADQDIWDDSALVASWNEALAEYKKYHSIHATGGKLEDIVPEHAKPETSNSGVQHGGGGGGDDDGIAQQDDENRMNGKDGGLENAQSGDTDDTRHSAQQRHEPSQTSGDKSSGGGASAMAPPPQALLGSVQDEGLKRLLMSWYYAGYYTGLWEGEQKHRTEQQQQHPQPSSSEPQPTIP